MTLRRLCLFLLPLLLAPAVAPAKELTRADVETIVKETIATHPEIVIDALKNYQMKQQAASAGQARQALKTHQREIFNDGVSPVVHPNGDVTLVEFFDYHCGYCKRMLPIVTKLIDEDKRLRVVFKEFPILTPESATAAKAALSVWRLEPDKYFDYYKALLGSAALNDDVIFGAAEKLGINKDRLKKEMDKPAIADILKKNHELAEALNIRGTPAFIIGDHLIGGATSYEDLKKQISDVRHAR